jgi:hypothetical protein
MSIISLLVVAATGVVAAYWPLFPKQIAVISLP